MYQYSKCPVEKFLYVQEPLSTYRMRTKPQDGCQAHKTIKPFVANSGAAKYKSDVENS